MSARLRGMRGSGAWFALAGALLLVPPAMAAEDSPAPIVAIQVEPPAPPVIDPPVQEASRPGQEASRLGQEASSLGREVRPVASSRGTAGSLPDRLDLPEAPQVVVEVPPPAPEAPAAAPARTAETASESRSESEAERLAAAIQRRLADPALPLPPKFGASDREGLSAAYAAGNHQALWIEGGAWNPAAESLIDRLGRADEDGLEPGDYPVPRLAGGRSGAEDLAEAELKLSAAAYLYARDARGGRIEPRRIGGLVTPRLDLPGVERVLATLAASEDAGAALQGFNPGYPGYAALREKLAELRATHPQGEARRRAGTRLASAGEARVSSRWSPRLEGDLVANMERWRWLPSRVGESYILVNIPEFRLRLVEEGRVIHEARVITGSPSTPTPVFSHVMEYAIVNPSWFIPPSILRKDVLPGLARDPGYAARRGYQVTQRRGVTSVRMPPGPRNALGYIKFMFPNDHAVYLHDTPNRGLFGSSSRALSHGCVRLEHPFALGGKILGPSWSESRLKGLIGHGERTIMLGEPLPIHLAYFTATVGEDGELRTFGDVYGYHRRVRMALGLGA